MQSPTITSPLDAFLQQPNIEASPAWEFIHGQPQQKPMPTLFHSRLQRNLVNAINNQTQAYEAIQELRCIVPPLSPVPDIAIVKSDRLSEIDGSLQGSPDWLIEIRSPDQSAIADLVGCVPFHNAHPKPNFHSGNAPSQIQVRSPIL